MIFAALPTGQHLQTLVETIKNGYVSSQYRMVPSNLYLPTCTSELSALLIGIKNDGSILHGIRYYAASKSFVKVSEDDYINIHDIIGWRYGNVILENNGYTRVKDNVQISAHQVFGDQKKQPAATETSDFTQLNKYLSEGNAYMGFIPAKYFHPVRQADSGINYGISHRCITVDSDGIMHFANYDLIGKRWVDITVVDRELIQIDAEIIGWKYVETYFTEKDWCTYADSNFQIKISNILDGYVVMAPTPLPLSTKHLQPVIRMYAHERVIQTEEKWSEFRTPSEQLNLNHKGIKYYGSDGNPQQGVVKTLEGIATPIFESSKKQEPPFRIVSGKGDMLIGDNQEKVSWDELVNLSTSFAKWFQKYCVFEGHKLKCYHRTPSPYPFPYLFENIDAAWKHWYNNVHADVKYDISEKLAQKPKWYRILWNCLHENILLRMAITFLLGIAILMWIAMIFYTFVNYNR